MHMWQKTYAGDVVDFKCAIWNKWKFYAAFLCIERILTRKIWITLNSVYVDKIKEMRYMSLDSFLR